MFFRLRNTHILSILIIVIWASLQVQADILIKDNRGDPYGASVFSDILEVKVQALEREEALLMFKIKFNDASQGVTGAILLDTDGNRRTPRNQASKLTEAEVKFHIAILGICTAQFFDSEGAAVDLSCEVQGNDFFVFVPRKVLNNSISENLEIAVISSSFWSVDGRDRAPDQGFVKWNNGEVHIQNEGLKLNQLIFVDEADSSAPTDLSSLEIRLADEQLMIEVSYHHSIEATNVNRVTMGMISIDADADIMTGFQNVAGIYPTFGVDAFVSYSIYPSFVGGKTEASLALKDPEHPAETANIPLGSYSSDTSYRRISEKKIELSLPVALIPPINSNSFIVADTMAPETDLVDSLPNNGGIRLGDGSIKLFNQPETPDKSLTDAKGDSFAFGGDNDDLIGIKGSFCQAGALIEISYSDFKLGGRAMTTVHLDLDYNSRTGEETINFSQNTKLGIEKSLVYKITDLSGGTQHARQVPNTAQVAPIGGTAGSVGFFTGILVEGSTGDLIDGYNQLFTIDYIRNKVYITVPYELLQNQNLLGVHAWTISGTFGIGTIVDEVPDKGSLIIKKTSYATPKDLNQDGKIDIFDLMIVGNSFGKNGSNLKADVNQNGIVDIFDLVLIGKYFS